MFVSTALRHPGPLSGAAGGHDQPSSRTACMGTSRTAALHPNNNYDLRNEGPSARTVPLSIISACQQLPKKLFQAHNHLFFTLTPAPAHPGSP